MMKVFQITGIIETRTALHVGSGESNELADSMLRRDTKGDLIIPGTAIAGALRSQLTRLAPNLDGGICRALLPEKFLKTQPRGCRCGVCQLFGDIDPNDDSDSSTASKLFVANAGLEMDPTHFPVLRDHVGMDRSTGAAARASQSKFNIEVLPAHAQFTLRMELRDPEPRDEWLLASVLSEWASGRGVLGANVARGLGAFDLKCIECQQLDMDDPDILIQVLVEDDIWSISTPVPDWLIKHTKEAQKHLTTLSVIKENAMGEWKNLGDTWDILAISKGWVQWDLTLQAQGPFLTHDTTAAGISGFDHAPLLQSLGDWSQPVLPGSSLRGVLRSQAERIARTIVTYHAQKCGDKQDAIDHFLQHCPACNPLSQRRERDDPAPLLESCDSALRFELGLDDNMDVENEQLCLACRLFGSTRRGSRLRIEDAPFVGGTPVYKMLDFLAIDRFTGGGAEHLKFDAVALWRPAFQVRLFIEDPRDWELGWLSLVLRDLAEGMLHVGYGSAKGFGLVTTECGTMTVASLDEKPVDNAATVFSTKTIEMNSVDWYDRQKTWIQAFHTKLAENSAKRKDLPWDRDSYFGQGHMTTLYPLYRSPTANQEG